MSGTDEGGVENGNQSRHADVEIEEGCSKRKARWQPQGDSYGSGRREGVEDEES